ncbi:hypothetical protein PCM19_11610 [Staphylococcus aureus]|nr:hypothetical protein PCM19_11610 [Staphylococcus aureus]
MENESIIEVQLSGIKEDVTKLQEDHDKTKERQDKQSSPDSCVKCYTMFLPFLLIKIDVFS